MDFHQPRSLEEATAILARQDCLLLAGGTDVYPAHVSKPITRPVLDLSRVAGLRGISETQHGFSIGAATTWSDIVTAALPPAFDGLKQAAREVGSIQIQNRATVAGNLCNASPAADGVPPLLTLDAVVTLSSATGTRHLPLEDFILGNRKTARAAHEIVTSVTVPAGAARGHGVFAKLGARRYLVISIAMVSVRVERGDNGRIASCAVAVGACGPAARRMRRLEQFLVGQRPDAISVPPGLLDGLSPIDDVRASAAYRLEAARELIVRAVRDAAQ